MSGGYQCKELVLYSSNNPHKAEADLLFPSGLTGLMGSGEIWGAKGSICLSSCIFSLMGLRTPQQMFRKPSTTTSPSAPCWTERRVTIRTTRRHVVNVRLRGLPRHPNFLPERNRGAAESGPSGSSCSFWAARETLLWNEHEKTAFKDWTVAPKRTLQPLAWTCVCSPCSLSHLHTYVQYEWLIVPVVCIVIRV